MTKDPICGMTVEEATSSRGLTCEPRREFVLRRQGRIHAKVIGDCCSRDDNDINQWGRINRCRN